MSFELGITNITLDNGVVIPVKDFKQIIVGGNRPRILCTRKYGKIWDGVTIWLCDDDIIVANVKIPIHKGTVSLSDENNEYCIVGKISNLHMVFTDIYKFQAVITDEERN